MRGPPRERTNPGLVNQGVSSDLMSPTRHWDGLARKVVGGDRSALSELLTSVRDQVLEHALARTQEPDDAEDIAQEVLIGVLKSLHSFRFQSRLSSWVYRITENQILSLFRSRTAVELGEERVRLGEGIRHPESPSEGFVDADVLLDRVNAAVECLPELQGQVFRLVALQDWKPREAAKALGKSQTNVRASLSRARVKVRSQLLEHAPALVRDLGWLGPHWAA